MKNKVPFGTALLSRDCPTIRLVVPAVHAKPAAPVLKVVVRPAPISQGKLHHRPIGGHPEGLYARATGTCKSGARGKRVQHNRGDESPANPCPRPFFRFVAH